MKKYAIFAVLAAVPIFSIASIEVDKGLMCNQSTNDFFAPLIQNDSIELKPYKIDDKFISYFNIKNNKSRSKKSFYKKGFENGITAFGMPVISVFGYADGQILFPQNPLGKTPDVYGVAVEEGIANVQAQLRSVGSTKATTYRIDASKTFIICKGV